MPRIMLSILFTLLLAGSAVAVAPVVVMDFNGEFILDESVTEELKTTYVGGAVSMLRETNKKLIEKLYQNDDDWDIYLKVEKCYRSNEGLKSEKIVTIILNGCK